MTISNQSYCFSGIVTLYFFFLVFLVLHAFASPCGHDQRDALLEFKHEFLVNKSNSSPLLSSWNKSSDCCSWEGVTCYAKSGKVISLDLSYTRLSNSSEKQYLTLKDCDLYGKIPSSLGNFSHLKKLDLSENDLMEINIPISFANLIKLSTFDISYHQFTGEFPLSLLNLTSSLTGLDVGDNLFKSTFSSDMSGFHNLEFFHIGGNSFSGPFPTSLFMFSLLRRVDLGRNQFKGPIVFKNVSSSPKFWVLTLDQNKFDGPIPKSLSKFENLVELDLSHNNFSGSFPKSSDFDYLTPETLCLSNNNLEGEIPSWFGGVLTLLVSHNSFSSFGKLDYGYLDGDIQTMDFSSNSFQGPLPHCLCKLNPLTPLNLGLSNNNFSGSIPRCLRNTITVLRGLNLQNNNLTGILPDVFVNATELVLVDVSNNRLEGKLPESLINCISLLLLNVKNNKIKDKFPSRMGYLPSLNVLILGSNDFYGPLYHHPHMSIGFQSLKIIDISHNHFNGTLPPFYFANWSEMTTLKEDRLDYMEYSYLYRISMEMVNKGFQRQNCSAFMDNPKLFGLEDICGKTDHVPSLTPKESEDFSEPKEQVISWKAAVIAYVPVLHHALAILVLQLYQPSNKKSFVSRCFLLNHGFKFCP
ncbi:hypothetical protein Bca52824_068062 [Brassica carinata]|uniref:Leucine-rich repeat-containing N-terminal plant-type domain-containing protein n=1 Tax=Brassica carinata TaxID=52824 RepID=A0A8X7Q153_BRACI|nr:hypothetical protein Bca52824_068062 [Brassica carinata]